MNINKIISWTETDNSQCEGLLYDGTNQEQFIQFGLKYGVRIEFNHYLTIKKEPNKHFKDCDLVPKELPNGSGRMHYGGMFGDTRIFSTNVYLWAYDDKDVRLTEKNKFEKMCLEMGIVL